jgi:hypothetical protein
VFFCTLRCATWISILNISTGCGDGSKFVSFLKSPPQVCDEHIDNLNLAQSLPAPFKMNSGTLESFERGLNRGEVDISAAETLCEYLVIEPTVLPETQRQSILTKLSGIFPYKEGNDVLARLITLLMKHIPFSFLLDMYPSPDFAAGLDMKAPRECWDLTLNLLSMAERDDVRRLASNYRAVFGALVRFWLCTPDASLSQAAARVLVRSLEAEDDAWKRVLRDRDVYGLILGICQAGRDDVVTLDYEAKSYAQTRLLEVLARLARLNWSAVTHSQLADVEAKYGLREGEGLVQFAVLRMVDWRKDPSMHIMLINFFVAILDRSPDDRGNKTTSPALEFLMETGIHDEILKRYSFEADDEHISQDMPWAHSILYPSLAQYVSTFLSNYPDSESFAANIKDILNHITQSLQNARWSQPSTAVWQDLTVLITVPPTHLRSSRSPLFLIPIETPSKAGLDALGAIFHGRERDPTSADGALLETLFRRYADLHPTFVEKLLAHADRPDAPELSVAALECLRNIVSAPGWRGARALMGLRRSPLVVDFLSGFVERPAYWSHRAREVAELRLRCARALLDGLRGWEDADGKWMRALERRLSLPLFPSREDPAAMVATLGR